jgi:hypothetical protein
MQVAQDGSKNIVDNLQVRVAWETLGVPDLIVKGLQTIKYDYPSKIQLESLKTIKHDASQNYFFQAGNG